MSGKTEASKRTKAPVDTKLVTYVARALGGHSPTAWKALEADDRRKQLAVARRAVGAMRRYAAKKASKG
jgi:hypothetical protein